MTELIVSFTHLAPTNEGTLRAQVNVSAVYESSMPPVATVAAVHPRINVHTHAENATLLHTDAYKLTVIGTGFDATRTTDNVFTFAPENKTTVRALVVQSTMTTLQLSFTHLAATDAGSK